MAQIKELTKIKNLTYLKAENQNLDKTKEIKSRKKIILDKLTPQQMMHIIEAAFCYTVLFPNGFQPLPPFLDNLEELFKKKL